MAADRKLDKVMTPRLLAIADCVKKGSKVADIGTDHGYIPIYLYKKGIIKYAIAMDINQGPLQKAKENILSYHAENAISTRISNGMEQLSKDEADTIIIAGMGGILINEILNARPDLYPFVDTFILQPMTAAEETRKYLEQNGFTIVHEVLAKEGFKLYTVMVAKRGIMKVEREVYYHIGHKLMEKKIKFTEELIDNKCKEYQKIIQGLSASQSRDSGQKLQDTKDLLAQLYQLKKECKRW